MILFLSTIMFAGCYKKTKKGFKKTLMNGIKIFLKKIKNNKAPVCFMIDTEIFLKKLAMHT